MPATNSPTCSASCQPDTSYGTRSVRSVFLLGQTHLVFRVEQSQA